MEAHQWKSTEETVCEQCGKTQEKHGLHNECYIFTPHTQPQAPVGTEIDEIMSRLYRRFKEWNKRGFGPDDVTWCEVKADVQEIISAEIATLRIQLADRDRHIAEAYSVLGDVNRSIYLFHHIHKLRASHEALVKALEALHKRFDNDMIVQGSEDDILFYHVHVTLNTARKLEADLKG